MAATVPPAVTTPKLTADDVELQLAEATPRAFTRDGWGFELKYDGFRVLVERIDGVVRLLLRKGSEATKQFPEVVEAFAAVPGGDFIIDGELVIQDAVGRPIFQKLLQRGRLSSAREIDARMRADPAVYFAFDLLMDDGVDLRARPLRERKARLFERVKKGDRVLPVEHIEREGEALLEAVKAQQLEGIVAKDLSSRYQAGRHNTWLKLALTHVADFVVVGYADDFNALYLATWDGQQFVYAGKVGAGVTPKVMAGVKKQLLASTIDAPPFVGEHPGDKEARWVTPELVIEVRFKNWPEQHAVREPVFLRFRDDKDPVECPTPHAGHVPAPVAAAVKVSNVDKVLFPDDGITKGEVVEYYRQVSRWLLPYLRDRPLMMTRYPDGIRGKNFFQKNAPLKSPDFVRTVRVRNEEEKRDIDQIVCDDLRTLEWCANLATLPLHLPAGRVAAPGFADWCVVDFDPKGAPFEDVITLARALHERCERAGLPTYVKTSGSSGLHVMIPLGGQLEHEASKQLAELLAAMLVQDFPKLATTERVMKKRESRIYVDAYQNGPGRLIASPFCVRALPTAPVSMPLLWDEVKPGLTPRQFTIRNAIARLEELGDPMAPLITEKVSIEATLGLLTSG